MNSILEFATIRIKTMRYAAAISTETPFSDPLVSFVPHSSVLLSSSTLAEAVEGRYAVQQRKVCMEGKDTAVRGWSNTAK